MLLICFISLTSSIKDFPLEYFGGLSNFGILFNFIVVSLSQSAFFLRSFLHDFFSALACVLLFPLFLQK